MDGLSLIEGSTVHSFMFSEISRKKATDAAPCSSKETTKDQHDGSRDQVDITDVHHQYFTVATSFLKDIISESAKVGAL